MNRKTGGLLISGCLLLLASFGLGWRAFGTTFSGPIPAIICPVAAIVSLILAVYLIATAICGLENVESTSLLHRLGTLVLIVGIAVSLYAATAFFLRNELPPNSETSRLPSLYLLFAGMAVMFVGTAVRNFRLRR
jgi:hypothetical protein